MAQFSTDQINQARTMLNQAKGVLISIHKNPTIDSVAASLSLYLAISTWGKQVTLVGPDPAIVEFSRLVGVDKIKNNLNNGTGRNLVISFPYQEGSIEKVSYNIENDKFNLVIEPRDNYPSITPENIQYSFSGGDIDLILTIGATKLADLDQIYQDNQALFNNTPVINIDFHNQNQKFGKVNLVDNNVSSLSELTVGLLSQLGLDLTPDAASNLLAGIKAGSQNFTSNQTTAETFEAAAICLRHSGKRAIKSTATVPMMQKALRQKTTPQPFHKPLAPSFQPQPTRPSSKKVGIVGKSQPAKPKAPPAKIKKQPPSQTPNDWLKPKIYKGSTLL